MSGYLQQSGFIGGKNPFERRPPNWSPESYQDVLDDWESRVKNAPVFGPTFEGVDFNTPSRRDLLGATENFVNTANKVGSSFSSGELTNPASKPSYGIDLKNSAENFRDAFVANSQDLRSKLGSTVQPVSSLLSEFFRISPGANQGTKRDLSNFRHEIYSHLYPYQHGLSPDYRTFQAKNRVLQASPILPFNEALAEYVDRGLEGHDVVKTNAGSKVAGMFQELARADARADSAFSDPEVMKMWEKYHNFNPTQQQTNQIHSTFNNFNTKYIQPAATRYRNLMQAQIPEQFWKNPDPYSGPLLSADLSLSGTLSRTNSMLNRFGIPEVFDKDFLSNNYLFSQDPISAGLKEVGRNVRGAALGVAASALNPEVAKAVERDNYKVAGQTVLRDVAAGAAMEGGVRALSTVAPRLAGAASGVLGAAAPVLTGAALFSQGMPGSLTDVVTRKAASAPVSWLPSVKPNPRTDLGAQLSRSIPKAVNTAVDKAGNEIRYAGEALKRGRVPYLNVPIPFFGR